MEYTTLSNGVKMPMVGYGVYQVSPQECERCVLDALGAGYRSLDTAQSYFNEAQVGSAIRRSGVPREDIFLTTKVWVEHYGQQAARASVLDSMEKLGVDYLDLVLLHQPFADYYGAWRALEELYDEGRVRAIGVSNFYPDRLVDLASFARIRPMVDQVEIHPFHQQAEALKWMEKYGVQAEAWAPFGEGRGGLFTHPVLTDIGRRHGRTAAQVMLAGICSGAWWSSPSPPMWSACGRIWTCSVFPSAGRRWRPSRRWTKNRARFSPIRTRIW